MSDCIFCKIINGEIPSSIVYENDKVLAFNDISPQAPVHVIIIPKEHIESVEQINEQNASIISDIILAAKECAKILGLSSTGYRLINNCGKGAGQTVFHLHFHLLGGKELLERLV